MKRYFFDFFKTTLNFRRFVPEMNGVDQNTSETAEKLGKTWLRYDWWSNFKNAKMSQKPQVSGVVYIYIWGEKRLGFAFRWI